MHFVIVANNGLGYILGDFLNSSGHPGSVSVGLVLKVHVRNYVRTPWFRERIMCCSNKLGKCLQGFVVFIVLPHVDKDLGNRDTGYLHR
jgi:hypothetical protein